MANTTIKNYNGIDDFESQAVKIPISAGVGLGVLAEGINKVAGRIGVRVTFNIQAVGAGTVMIDETDGNFAINGVTAGKVTYENRDKNGSLITATSAARDITGVQAALNEEGKLVLISADGRRIKIIGSIGADTGIAADILENYGRPSLMKNDSKNIAIGGTGFGFENSKLTSQISVSLRETKG